MGEQTGAELAQHRVVEACVGRRKTERILPVDPAPHGISRLAVGQVLHERQHHSQGEPTWRFGRLAVARKQFRELMVLIHGAKRVGDAQAERILGASSTSNAAGFIENHGRVLPAQHGRKPSRGRAHIITSAPKHMLSQRRECARSNWGCEGFSAASYVKGQRVLGDGKQLIPVIIG